MDASPRILFLLAATVVHGLAFLALNDASKVRPSYSSGSTLVAIHLQPTLKDDGATSQDPDLSQLLASVAEPFDRLNFASIPIDFSESHNGGAAMSVPILKQAEAASLQPYIAQAALLPGEGATTVLRVEVLETGEPGRIEIDASSGSTQIDQAAIAYARTNHWYAGRINGSLTRMWIRWGVRLQA